MNNDLEKLNILNTNEEYTNEEYNINYFKKTYDNFNKLDEINFGFNNYMINLFIQYNESKGHSPDLVLKYLKECNITNYKLLLKSNPEFRDWLRITDGMRQFYMNQLYKMDVDLYSKNTYEINKGGYDTAVSNFNKIISKYAQTLNMYDSIIYKKDGKIYEVSTHGYISEIPEGKTFIIHNPYNIIEVLYTLEVLAGTDNTVILGSWGLTTNNETRIKKLKDYRKLLNLLKSNDNMDKSQYEEEVVDNVYCDSIKINTKNLKQIISCDELLTKADLEIIECAKFFSKDEITLGECHGKHKL